MGCRKLILVSTCTLLLSGCGIWHDRTDVQPVIPRNCCTCSEEHRKNTLVGYANSDSQQLIGQTRLDLAMLIDIACENNPSVKRAWHAARAERARAKKAKSGYLPTVVLLGQAGRTEGSSPIAAQHAVQKSVVNFLYPSIELNYSLFQFGGTMLSAEAAKYALYAANYQFNRTLQTVVHDVEIAYLRLSSAEQTVIAKKDNLEDARGIYESAFTRHQSGLTNVQEYLQAKASKSQAEFELEHAVADVESARAVLAQLIGVRVSDGVEIFHPVIQNDLHDTNRSIDDLMTEVVRTRPDVKAAYSQVIAKKKLARSTRSNLLPQLVVGGSVGKKKYQHFSGSYNDFNVFAGIRWEIFDGFRNIYDMIEAKENARIAQAEFEQLALKAQAEVWSNYFSFKSALKQVDAARRYFSAAEESFQSMTVSYSNGLCKFTDLSSAQSCLANAREKLIAAENNLLITISDLAYSTGGLMRNDLMNEYN